MLKILLMISGSGSNLQAIIDGIERGTIENTEIVGVISNNKNAYGLERGKSHGIPTRVVSRTDYANKDEFNQGLLDVVKDFSPDLVVLAGFLVVIPENLIRAYPNKIINIHPSLIPAFCGTG